MLSAYIISYSESTEICAFSCCFCAVRISCFFSVLFLKNIHLAYNIPSNEDSEIHDDHILDLQISILADQAEIPQYEILSHNG